MDDMKFSMAAVAILTFSTVSAHLLATIPQNKHNPFFNHFVYPLTVIPSKVNGVLPLAAAVGPCQRELKYAAQRLDETILTLENVKNDMEVLKSTSQSLAKTMVTIWILATTKLEESLQQSAQVSQLLSESNNNIVNFKNNLNEAQKDLAETKAKVGNLTNELRASNSAASIGKIPNSCGDLMLIGHRKSGLYSILGNKSIESVYCDFTKYPEDSEFQKFIGSAGVKSSPTYFYVQKNNSFSAVDVPIPFEIERLNIGGAMDSSTGTFTAPTSGTYHFSFTGLAEFPASNEFEHLEIRLYSNGIQIGTGHTSKAGAIDYQFSQLTLQSTLNLRKGDQIWLQITAMSDGVYLYDAQGVHHTHFTGFLLEEDFS